MYEDIASGKDTSKEGFQSMRWDAHDGLFDIVLVKSASRLSRNAEEAIEIVREFKGLGIEVKFETEEENSYSLQKIYEISKFLATSNRN